MQSPTPPFAGGVDASHGFGAHVAATKFPAEHTDAPETMYPSSHPGWHVDPDASSSVQSPTSPFKGAVDASHGSPTAARHVAGTIVPSEPHEVAPDASNPELHSGWHVDPGASLSVQSPTAPFAGAADASHRHVAGTKFPSAEHVDGPETVCVPSAHVGWHVDPAASSDVQSPTAPFAGGADASHVRAGGSASAAMSSPTNSSRPAPCACTTMYCPVVPSGHWILIGSATGVFLSKTSTVPHTTSGMHGASEGHAVSLTPTAVPKTTSGIVKTRPST